MHTRILLAVLAYIVIGTDAQPRSIGGGAAQLSDVRIQYTTDGEVRISVLNITFVTTELRVVLLGCDVGYFDNYLLFPPTPSWKTEVTPFDCRECRCSAFEQLRSETFVPADV